MVEHVNISGCFLSGPLIAEHLFAGMPKHTLEAFTRLRRRRLLREGVPIASKGTEVENICILCSGSAVIRIPSDPENAIVREVVPNELLGIPEVFSKSAFEYDVITTVPCFIDCVSADDFMAFMSKEPEFSFRLLTGLGSNLQKSYIEFTSASADRPDNEM